MQMHLMLQIRTKFHCFKWLKAISEVLSQTCVVTVTNIGYVCTRAIHMR